MPKQVAPSKKNSTSSVTHKRLLEGGFIISLFVSLFILISLASYYPGDPSFSHSMSEPYVAVRNAGGMVGAWIGDILYVGIGYLALIIPLFASYFSWQLMRENRQQEVMNGLNSMIRVLGFFLFLAGSCGLLGMLLIVKGSGLPYGAGGIVGQVIFHGLNAALNPQGALLLLIALCLTGVTLLTGLSWVWLTEKIGQLAFLGGSSFFYTIQSFISTLREQHQARTQSTKSVKVEIKRKKPEPKNTEKSSKKETKKLKILSVPDKPNLSKRYVKEKQVPLDIGHPSGQSELPPLDLLDAPAVRSNKGYSNQDLEDMSRNVEQNLQDFGVQAQVVAVHPGPVITRFELELMAGQKVSKLTALAKDLARSLSVTSVRVVEVIPGKSVVGLELPNQHREMVRLSEVLNSERFDQSSSPLSLALGVDIAGHPMVVDLAKMPHLLVAGTTGSGKSVGINAMLLSLLFKSSPEDVRLILVDPKMLELSVYDGIPHLLTPVVTDMKEAASALRWSVGEMERRYRLMAALGVRNINGYNNKVKEAKASGEPLLDPLWTATCDAQKSAPELTHLPYVVVVIDELADMMMVVGKKVEQLIARIAQKARAAGIHLILATQRPSVDVLTGLIKSNVPTRMSFQVSSKIDSRTILDQQGAEQLLGHGDMLYLAPGTGTPLRVHGAFVDDKEVHRVTSDWCKRGQPDYIEEIVAGGGDLNELNDDGMSSGEESDPLYDQAVEFVTHSRKASISAVQRRLKVGYNRAARLVEDMERAGVIGPMESGAREVLAPPPPEN